MVIHVLVEDFGGVVGVGLGKAVALGVRIYIRHWRRAVFI